jgi:hypothetical protein
VFAVALGWKRNPELRDVVSPEPDTIETVRNVDLAQVDWPKAWICVHDVLQQSLEGPAEAHSFFRG